MEKSPFVSAVLRFRDRFDLMNSGSYTCVIQSSTIESSQSKVIVLQPVSDPVSLAVIPTACLVKSAKAHFRIRILFTNCFDWGIEAKERIKAQLLNIMTSAVVSLCQDCVIDFNSLMGTVTCSEKVKGAAEINGFVTSGDVSQTGAMFCALRKWQITGPPIVLDEQVYYVDSDCVIGI